MVEVRDIPCSAIVLWETARAIARKRSVPMAIARSEVESFVTDFAIRMVPLGDKDACAAVDAHDRYGRVHQPARLNLGDCFADACTKTSGAKLLYKGDDFALTDLA